MHQPTLRECQVDLVNVPWSCVLKRGRHDIYLSISCFSDQCNVAAALLAAVVQAVRTERVL